MTTSQKTVLFVDDDTDFMDLIHSLAGQVRGDEWKVFTATTTAQALRILGAHEVDLAVLDLRMPIVDGLQFLQLIHRKYPQMKKALLSSYPDDARRQNAMQYGAELVLTKPLGSDEFEILFETLAELLRTRTEEGFRGVLRKIGLEDILQMECLSRHTSLVEVTAKGQHGRIFINTGKLVHAEFGEDVGEDALNRMLILPGGEFLHSPYFEPPARTLNNSWEFLLMEAARHRDESRAASHDALGETADGLAGAGSPSGIREVVVVGDRGELLYQRGATDPAGRIAVLKLLQNLGRHLEQPMGFGMLERVEFDAPKERLVARIHEQGGVFIRGPMHQ